MESAGPCVFMAAHSWCTSVCGLVSASGEEDPHAEASGSLPWLPALGKPRDDE